MRNGLIISMLVALFAPSKAEAICTTCSDTLCGFDETALEIAIDSGDGAELEGTIVDVVGDNPRGYVEGDTVELTGDLLIVGELEAGRRALLYHPNEVEDSAFFDQVVVADEDEQIWCESRGDFQIALADLKKFVVIRDCRERLWEAGLDEASCGGACASVVAGRGSGEPAATMGILVLAALAWRRRKVPSRQR